VVVDGVVVAVVVGVLVETVVCVVLVPVVAVVTVVVVWVVVVGVVIVVVVGVVVVVVVVGVVVVVVVPVVSVVVVCVVVVGGGTWTQACVPPTAPIAVAACARAHVSWSVAGSSVAGGVTVMRSACQKHGGSATVNEWVPPVAVTDAVANSFCGIDDSGAFTSS
jgi:hypothetical protein